MHRSVTAIYPSHTTTELVRGALTGLGIDDGRIHVVPDAHATVGAIGMRDDPRHIDNLHALNLPEEDVRSYEDAVRRGDYVVSVKVEGDAVERVTEIMRRPEAEARHVAPSPSEALVAPGRDVLGNRDPGVERDPDSDYVDPHARGYRRDERLDERRRE